jgi:hypothetical protein
LVAEIGVLGENLLSGKLYHIMLYRVVNIDWTLMLCLHVDQGCVKQLPQIRQYYHPCYII